MARAKRQSGNLDLLIIGGGINGLGIAADAAARGLSVLLVITMLISLFRLPRTVPAQAHGD